VTEDEMLPCSRCDHAFDVERLYRASYETLIGKVEFVEAGTVCYACAQDMEGVLSLKSGPLYLVFRAI
jgi:hypothetical protein